MKRCGVASGQVAALQTGRIFGLLVAPQDAERRVRATPRLMVAGGVEMALEVLHDVHPAWSQQWEELDETPLLIVMEV